MATTKEVLARHLKSFSERDLEGILSDYAPGAVFFTPEGPRKGKDQIRPFFQSLLGEFSKPDSSFCMTLASVDGDHAFILWTAETADNFYEMATDTFVVRNDKIVAQSFAGKITSKA